MNYLDNNCIKNEVIDKLIEELENYRDTEHYACELAYDLLEGYNIDGTITYSTQEAKQWIKNNFDDLGEIVAEREENGYSTPNLFDNPELFMVVIYLEVANYVMDKCKFINDNWDGTFTLNDKNIYTITKQLRELKDEAE